MLVQARFVKSWYYDFHEQKVLECCSDQTSPKIKQMGKIIKVQEWLRTSMEEDQQFKEKDILYIYGEIIQNGKNDNVVR